MDKVIHVDDAYVTGIGALGTETPYHNWGLYWMHTHSHEKENIFDPDLPYFSPEIMVAFNLSPDEMNIMHQKTSLCQRNSEKCYDLLWKSDLEKFTKVREEL